MNTVENPLLVTLDDIGYLHVTGSDATKFLHAQFTNDLASLLPSSWQYSGYCTPKGRLLAFMTVFRLAEDEYLLIMPMVICETILPRLRMYVMRDDVSIALKPDNIGIAGILGQASSCGLDASAEAYAGRISENYSLLTISTQVTRYLLIAEKQVIAQLPCTAAEHDAWVREDILQGIPTVIPATSEAFVPQMVNLDLIHAVNFKKGCYPGQEIVARVHYLGKTKQRMFQLYMENAGEIVPGEKIYNPAEPDKACGTVVMAAPAGNAADSGHVLLAVLQTSAVVKDDALQLGSTSGATLTVAELPYDIPDLNADDAEA